ncbi:hypothetical protein BV25DRAFT_10048 [Artomyces pyxidatus]|uniref:Uncharacterized protein n=1 Tax=Artomyces pyxidatus TaxID=48021 RepID=A0ACB8TJC1_9AGAM|nr:hypothetical protein BV25DRAFT_10048 [Artomyces pyxidatus]
MIHCAETPGDSLEETPGDSLEETPFHCRRRKDCRGNERDSASNCGRTSKRRLRRHERLMPQSGEPRLGPTRRRRWNLVFPSSQSASLARGHITPIMLYGHRQLLVAILLAASRRALAQPTVALFDDCFSGNASLKLNVSTVYAQITTSPSLGRHLNLTVVGQTGQTVAGFSNGSSDLSTLFSSTEMLTFNVWNNNSYFCATLRPPSPLPPLSDNATVDYCPISPGPFAFSSYVPLRQSHELTTLQTRLRAVDPFSNELICIDVATTPLDPGASGSVYGHAKIVFWVTVVLAIAYFLLVAIARLSSAWGRRAGWSGRGFYSRVESTGFVIASAVSGEGLSKSPALIRFVTPSMRDIFFHTQWCAAVAMVAVQWPNFVCELSSLLWDQILTKRTVSDPLLTQTAWAMLTYNITLAQGGNASQDHWNPVSTPPFQPPAEFADQFSDQSSPLFIDTNVPNTLFTLPPDAASGLSTFAYTIGVRPQDLFGISLIVFLAIVAGTVVLSLLIWALDSLASLLNASLMEGREGAKFGVRSPRYSAASKDILDGVVGAQAADEDRSHNSHFLLRTTSRFPASSRKPWLKLRLDLSSFHFSILQGNLVRILLLFHLPVTIFSCYQMTLGRNQASLASIVLAALSFAAVSVLIPVLLVLRLSMTPTSKLYDETWTLLSLGPLYNHYRHGSQLFACLFFATNLAFGITIGCGQKSGTAQAIIMLVIEVISALVTSVWLPWGHGASMGLISFLFCVARIVIAVLLVILTPTVSIGSEAGQWVAYVILFILALVYLAFILMLVCKLVEALVRIFGGVGFDRSRHAVDGGLLGAFGLLGCCGPRKRRSQRGHRAKHSDLPLNTSQATFSRPSHKESTPTPSGPPSVLRPEHALRPYREESDDEGGFIMGAWQPFPRPGYNAVDGQSGPPPESPRKNASGFSRVGGGRAHFDAPYAIASGSTLTFPSVERVSTPRRQSFDSTPPITPSIAEAERHQLHPGLPPGAMPPHIRTKSQTAVIEDARTSFVTVQPPARRQSLRPEIVSPITDDDASDNDEPKKKYWFQLRKPRRHSEGDDKGPPPPPPEAAEVPARSFVVVRDRRGSQPLASGSGTAGEGSSSEPQEPKSFVVIRGKNSPAANS